MAFTCTAFQAALAAAPSGSLPMAGQASVDQSGSQPRISLDARATDGSGWRLTADFVAQTSPRARRGSASASPAAYTLSGRFTLQHTGIASIGGDLTGSMSQDGAGTLRLTSADGATSVESNLLFDSPTSVTLAISGQLPTLAPAGSQVATTPATDHTFWYVSRAAGLTAFVLLTLNVWLGLMVHTRALDWLMARWRSFDLHRFTAFLALAFLALHVFSLLGDHFIGYSLSGLLIPFVSPYRPIWVSVGIVSFYLLLIVTASFYVRRWIGYRTWRILHYVTFVAFVLALMHGILSGSDSPQVWAIALYWVTAMLTSALMIWRFTAESRRRNAPPRLVHSLDAAVPDA